MNRPSQNSVGYYRWLICALLFLATTINYVDRTVLGVLEPVLQKIIHWTPAEWSYINASFMFAYAIGFVAAGWMMDRLGTRLGFTIALVVWSLAAAAHAFAHSVLGFAVARFALGLGEAGSYPAAIKTIAEWFPKKERALAAGFINAGANVGAVVSPAVVPILYTHFGWQAAFVATGLVGMIWVLLWWPIYRRPQEHPWLSPAELAYIESDPPDPPINIPWTRLLSFRQTQAFAIAKFLTDSIWWFYLFWFPKFMNEQFGVDIKAIGLPMITVYLMADIGSIYGGWQSSWLLGRGWSANAARKTAMLICALCVVPVAMAPLVADKWTAVLLIGLATAAHQGFSANLFTLVSDIFPRRTVGSVVGIGGFAGATGGFLLQLCAGQLRELTGNYIAMFAIAASAYLTALVIIHALIPRVEPVEIKPLET